MTSMKLSPVKAKLPVCGSQIDQNSFYFGGCSPVNDSGSTAIRGTDELAQHPPWSSQVPGRARTQSNGHNQMDNNNNNNHDGHQT